VFKNMNPAECTVKIRVNPMHYLKISYADGTVTGIGKTLVPSKTSETLPNGKRKIVWGFDTAEGWVTEEAAREAAGMAHDQFPVGQHDDQYIAKQNEMPKLAMILGTRTKDQAKAGEDPLAKLSTPPRRRRRTPEAEGDEES